MNPAPSPQKRLRRIDDDDGVGLEAEVAFEDAAGEGLHVAAPRRGVARGEQTGGESEEKFERHVPRALRET
jgi:hypothetical protein